MKRFLEEHSTIIFCVLALLAVLTWALYSPTTDESMGRPYVVGISGDSAIVTLDEYDWKYRDKVGSYQFSYRVEGENWVNENQMSTKTIVIPCVEMGKTYEIKVVGISAKTNRKIAESDTVTVLMSEELNE